MFAQLAQDVEFVRPAIDWHAAAPELTLLGFGALVTLMDIIWLERGRRLTSAVASIALLGTMIPILTLAIDGTDRILPVGEVLLTPSPVTLRFGVPIAARPDSREVLAEAHAAVAALLPERLQPPAGTPPVA